MSRRIPLPGPCALVVEAVEDDDAPGVVLHAAGFLERPPWWGRAVEGAPAPLRSWREGDESRALLDLPLGVTLAELDAESAAQGGAPDRLVRNAVALGLALAIGHGQAARLPLGPLERGLCWLGFDGSVWWLGPLAALGAFVHAPVVDRELLSDNDEAPPPLEGPRGALASTDPRPLILGLLETEVDLKQAPELPVLAASLYSLPRLEPGELGDALRALFAGLPGADEA